MFSYLRHLNNCNDFIEISGWSLPHFRLIDRKMILMGYTTSVKIEDGIGVYIAVKQGEPHTEIHLSFLPGAFDRGCVDQIMRMVNRSKK